MKPCSTSKKLSATKLHTELFSCTLWSCWWLGLSDHNWRRLTYYDYYITGIMLRCCGCWLSGGGCPGGIHWSCFVGPPAPQPPPWPSPPPRPAPLPCPFPFPNPHWWLRTWNCTPNFNPQKTDRNEFSGYKDYATSIEHDFIKWY